MLVGKALILDFGSVVSFSVFEQRFEIADRIGLPRDQMHWHGPMDPDADPNWRAMIAGEFTEREYWAKMARDVGRRVGQEWAPLDYLQAARSESLNDVIRPEITELVSASKEAGAKVGVLSNELELFYGSDSLKGIDILQEMDAVVDATHTRILKPDPRAYNSILDALDVSVDRAVFVDDQPKNVAGAKAIGLDAVFFDVRQPAETCARIWDRLITI